MEGLEIQLLDLAHQGISRVRGRALVVERVLHHIVQGPHKIFFRYAIFFDAPLDAHFSLQVGDGLGEFFEDLVPVFVL